MTPSMTLNPTKALEVRWMIRRDMNDVLRIEHASYSSPWIEADFHHYLKQRNCIGMVAEQGYHIFGFMIYELAPKRIDLLNMAVDPEFRLQGVGAAMIVKLQSKLANQKRDLIRATVRETNLRAQQFFRDMRFRAVKVLRDAYEDTNEAAYQMEYRDEWGMR